MEVLKIEAVPSIKGKAYELPSFSDLNKLKILVVNRGRSWRWTEIPKSITGLKSLKKLDFGYCPLENIPESIVNLKNLEELNLQGCSLMYLPNSLSKLAKLEVLNISGNKFEKMPDIILKIPSLKKLIIGFRCHVSMDQMKKLIKKDVDVIDDHGATFFMTAIRRGRPDIIDILLSKRRNPAQGMVVPPQIQDVVVPLLTFGKVKTPLSNQQIKPLIERVEFFNMVNAQDNDGNTALHLAVTCDFENIEVIEKLIKAGADVNLKNEDGNTALHKAVGCDEDELAEKLIKAGADVIAILL